MKKRILIGALVLAAASAGLVAQDPPKSQKINVTGVWESTVESPQGAMTSTATYKQDGEKLTGKHVGQMGELPLAGTVKGNEIAFTITIDAQGQQFTLTYTGKIDGDTIAGSVDFGGMGTANWSAKRKK
jgi:hypothetical protein